MKIAAVLVTFNRKALLQEGLNSLRRELPVGTPIIVVDNASTDGTAQFLQEEQKQFPLLVYFISPENTGGAGGFASGLEIALRKTDADWFFLIDDDVEVLPGAFQDLEKYKAESQCLQFTKVYADGYREPMAGHFDIKAGRIRWMTENDHSNLPEQITINYGCFEGMLIHRRIVEKIGLPDPRFFIWQDDIAYGLKASFETKVLYLTKPRILRKIKPPKHPTRGISLYYLIRNQFLLEEVIKNHPDYSKLQFQAQILLRLFFKATQCVRTMGISSFKWAIRGYIDGLRGHFGKLETSL